MLAKRLFLFRVTGNRSLVGSTLKCFSNEVTITYAVFDSGRCTAMNTCVKFSPVTLTSKRSMVSVTRKRNDRPHDQAGTVRASRNYLMYFVRISGHDGGTVFVNGLVVVVSVIKFERVLRVFSQHGVVTSSKNDPNVSRLLPKTKHHR